MTKKRTEIFFILGLFLFYSFASGGVQHYSDVKEKIKKGLSKQTILELLGKPLEIKIIVKSNKFIWGPEENFWDRIPMGIRLEVWKYVFADGRLNLYFLNETDQLEYIAFAPKGVVY